MCRKITYNRIVCAKCMKSFEKKAKEDPCTEGLTKGFGKCKAGITKSTANTPHTC
jgi:hypothetical protein